MVYLVEVVEKEGKKNVNFECLRGDEHKSAILVFYYIIARVLSLDGIYYIITILLLFYILIHRMIFTILNTTGV